MPAQAATVLFNFGSSTGQANFGALSGTDANGRTYTATSGATTVKVRASGWSYNGTILQDSFLGAFGGGLGVTSGDDNAGADNKHTVDNQTRRDFILLQFDQKVSLTSAVFNAFKITGQSTADNDATIGYGTTAAPWNTQPGLNNQNISALNALIAPSHQYASNGSGSSAVRLINTSNFVGNIWLISASAANPDNFIDSFKLNTLTVNSVNSVPEPATWGMMILGFGLVGAAVRKRHQSAAFA